MALHITGPLANYGKDARKVRDFDLKDQHQRPPYTFSLVFHSSSWENLVVYQVKPKITTCIAIQSLMPSSSG